MNRPREMQEIEWTRLDYKLEGDHQEEYRPTLECLPEQLHHSPCQANWEGAGSWGEWSIYFVSYWLSCASKRARWKECWIRKPHSGEIRGKLYIGSPWHLGVHGSHGLKTLDKVRKRGYWGSWKTTNWRIVGRGMANKASGLLER